MAQKWCVITCTGDGQLNSTYFDSEELAREGESLARYGMTVTQAKETQTAYWNMNASSGAGPSYYPDKGEWIDHSLGPMILKKRSDVKTTLVIGPIEVADK